MDGNAHVSPVTRHIFAVHAILYGFAYMFGPTSSPTLSAIAQLGVPFPVYGALFTAAGAALLRYTWPHAVLCALLTLWALGQATTIVTGQITSLGGIAHAGAIAAVHGVATYRRKVRRLARRGRHEA